MEGLLASDNPALSHLAPDFDTDRYLSVLLSASTETSKGVQCSPSKKDCSTQTGSSSITTASSSLLDETHRHENLSSEFDSDSDNPCSSDDEYNPGPSLTAVSDKRVTRKTQMKSHGKMNEKTQPISWVYVNIQELLLLFSYCPKCGGKILSSKVRFKGIAVSVDYVCTMCTLGSNPSTWHSSPIVRRKFVINIQISCCIALSGLRYQSIMNFQNLMELPTLSRPRFTELVRAWLYPTIYRMYSEGRDRICTGLKTHQTDGKPVVLCGDAQFDSPGFSAKYCTYTIMNCETNEVVDFAILQKGQVSGGLEHQAFRQVWESLIIEDGVKPNDLVIDRQATIAKIVADKYPETKINYDIWHMAKCLSKHLRTAGQSHPKISAWRKSLVNHLWYSCRACKGDPELAIEMFHSCLLHVLNIHVWTYKEEIFEIFVKLRESIALTRPYPKIPVKYAACKHGSITKHTTRSIDWFNVEEKDFLALFRVITATRFSNDLRNCAKFLHTGNLESFHSMKLQYLPKLHSFELDTMIVMTMLAAVQNNLYLKEEYRSKSYTARANSRAMKGYVLKQKNLYDNISFKKAIKEEIIEKMKSGTILVKCDFSQTRYVKKEVPKTFHGTKLPDKVTMIRERKSRMKS